MKRLIAVAATAALMLGLLALPASANKVPSKIAPGVPLKDAGVLSGTALVGKNRTGCANDGSGTVSGGGIGLPGVNANKNGYWSANLALTSVVNQHVGTLTACGRLDKMFSAVGGGLGAACGASKGWDGKGRVTYPASTGKPNIWLYHLGWKISVGGTLPVYGRAVAAASSSDAKAKFASGASDEVWALLNATGALPCLQKNDANKNAGPGAQNFTVNGVYEITNAISGDPNDRPVTCKEGLLAGCLYDPKKVGKNG